MRRKNGMPKATLNHIQAAHDVLSKTLVPTETQSNGSVKLSSGAVPMMKAYSELDSALKDETADG